MPKVNAGIEQAVLVDLLEQHDAKHLLVRTRGEHLIIYSMDDNAPTNRARLTKVSVQYYTLSMANHKGTWESTPYRGTLYDIVKLLMGQFAFALAPL